jgi:hypothetical protein
VDKVKVKSRISGETAFVRLAVAKQLLLRNFDLAFRALHAFGGGRPARTFVAVASILGRSNDLDALKTLLQSVQGTVTDEEWDEARLFWTPSALSYPKKCPFTSCAEVYVKFCMNEHNYGTENGLCRPFSEYCTWISSE